MTRENLTAKFASYPDVLTLVQFRELLGGIADSTARKLVNQNLVKHYMVRTTIFIPKQCAFDYIVSEHYRKYKNKLKHTID